MKWQKMAQMAQNGMSMLMKWHEMPQNGMKWHKML
jgi:hypothetical protein